MPSLVYYGLDKVENIPSTIPLTDSSFSITAPWNFTEITTEKITITTSFDVTSNASFTESVVIGKNLITKSDTLIQGDLYINRNPDNKSITNTYDRENYFKKTVSTNGIVQNNAGDLYCGNAHAVAYCALYRDLGERFAINTPAPKGSIVALGGEAEIKLATMQDQVFGVIATDPALRMNENAGTDETHPYICWAGRIPCRVIGKVKKFDKIFLSETAGVGTTKHTGHKKFVGIALENKDTIEEGSVEIVSKIQITY